MPGTGLGRAFLDQDFDRIAPRHRHQRHRHDCTWSSASARAACAIAATGRILITGSIAGFMPGTYQAVYNGTKALLDSLLLRAARTS